MAERTLGDDYGALGEIRYNNIWRSEGGRLICSTRCIFKALRQNSSEAIIAASCDILSFHLANDPTLGEVLVLMTIWQMTPECRVPDAQFHSGRFVTRGPKRAFKSEMIFS
jgi:hypothetical protein